MHKISFLSKRPWFLRTDILLLLVIYGGVLPLVYAWEPIPEIYIKFAFVLLFFFNCLFLFVCETGHKYKATHCFWRVQRVEEATHVHFVEHLKSGTVVHKVEDLVRATEEAPDAPVHFYHNKLKYYYEAEERKFRKVKPHWRRECQALVSPAFSPFVTPTEAKLMDKNQLKFPLPNFLQIFKEHIMDPLNFFQIFSVMLWFFDNDVFHPLMVLMLLLISNSFVCFQRISTIMNLRTLQTKPYWVLVQNQTTKGFDRVSSEDLKPGDVVVVQRTKELTVVDAEKVETDDIEEVRKMVPFGDKIPEHVLMRFLKNSNPGAAPTIKKPDEATSESSKIFNSVDLLILDGSVAVDESLLTGESLPQIKDPIDKKYLQETFTKRAFKNSVVFAGTDVLQTTPAEPGKKVLARVLNTGFYTTKGKLARMMLFNEENNATTQKDAYILLFLLLIVSLCSSLYVLLSNLDDETRNKDKLFIRCILIVTNVVPPELPMIMNMAVNASVMFLRGKKIFCTEPFRIPLAGKVETCVFDKTGTITQESLRLKGFAFFDPATNRVHFEGGLKNEKAVGFERMSAVLAGCHSLIEVNRVLTGDPIEALFFHDSDFRFSAGAKTATYARNTSKTVTIKRVHSFNSELKRMSTVVRVQGFDTLETGDYVVSKGAPEALSPLLVSKPALYDKWVTELAAEGFRLLALGIRRLGSAEANLDERDLLETNLEFVGFLVLSNDLKHDSREFIQRLTAAEREVVILTGDHLLTSLKTYKSLFEKKTEDASKLSADALNQKLESLSHSGSGPVDRKEHYNFGILSYSEGKRVLRNEFGHEIAADPSDQVLGSLPKVIIGISGGDFDFCLQKDPAALAFIKVVGRVSPKQKEAYIVQMQKKKHVLMCGDGSNDVGALKSAHVGIALVGMNDEPTKAQKLEVKKKKEEVVRKAMAERRMPRPDELTAMEGEIDFKLGDASIAAPFTNKHSNSIKCVETVLKQGVCTLSCGMQSYKIVTLSSFLTAYSLSKLHMENLKFSDMQNTLMSMYGAYLYYQLSNGKPVKRLSKDRPPNSIFNRYFWMSLFGQLVIQLVFTFLIGRFASAYKPPEEAAVDNEDEFVPTFTNSVMFVFDLASMFCISIFNYEGRPYMISLSENKKHFKFLMLPIALLALLIFEVIEDVNGLFQMTLVSPLKDVQVTLFAITFGFIGCSFLWTLLVRKLQHGKVERVI